MGGGNHQGVGMVNGCEVGGKGVGRVNHLGNHHSVGLGLSGCGEGVTGHGIGFREGVQAHINMLLTHTLPPLVR